MISSHIKPLTGVRFLAALAVVALHLREKIGGSPFVERVILCGHFAVPFFFILSGFILAHVYFPTYRLADHTHFMWLRFARLWPVHLAMFSAMVLYVGALTLARGYVPDHKYDFTVILPELAMVRSWYDDRFMWNGPAWSIQIEWFAYLFLFPLCALAIRPIRNRWILGALCVGLLVIHPLVVSMPSLIGTILCLFPAGCALYRLRVLLPNLAWANAIVWIAVAVSGAAMLLGLPYLCYLSLAGVVFGLSYDQGQIARLLSSGPLVYGGKISFSLYMSHIVVNTWAYEVWIKIVGAGRFWPPVVTFLASMATAAAVYRWIEVPANEWLRRRSPNRKKPAAAAALNLSSS